MNNQGMIPDDIAVLIEQKKRTLQVEHESSEKQKAEKRSADISSGREQLQIVVVERLLAIPEWLRPYDVTLKHWNDDELMGVGGGWKKLEGISLYFEIPGLAEIMQNHEGNWRAANPSNWRSCDYEDGFYRDSYWHSDLEYVLVEAESNFQEYLKMWREFEQQQEERQRSEKLQQNEQKASEIRDAAQKAEQDEEQQLFDALKDDPVALSLMKTFLLIRQERSMFEQQISEANDSIISNDERWSRKAEDLQRQAREADRRAEEERMRASDTENELDKAKKKIKQSERGW